MVILLNGPLGLGKSTLSEAFMEKIDQCVMLDGDHLVSMNPPPPNELEYLHATLALLIQHHKNRGYRTFVVNHIWRTAEDLDDLRRTLSKIDSDIRCFLLVLSLDENLRRIQIRQGARALDEQDFEKRTVMEERATLFESANRNLGERFDVSASPDDLVAALLSRLGVQ
nr:AAA domain protein [uncultured bacterium]